MAAARWRKDSRRWLPRYPEKVNIQVASIIIDYHRRARKFNNLLTEQYTGCRRIDVISISIAAPRISPSPVLQLSHLSRTRADPGKFTRIAIAQQINATPTNDRDPIAANRDFTDTPDARRDLPSNDNGRKGRLPVPTASIIAGGRAKTFLERAKKVATARRQLRADAPNCLAYRRHLSRVARDRRESRGKISEEKREEDIARSDGFERTLRAE